VLTDALRIGALLQSRCARQRSALREAWLLIVCLIFLAWVVGMLSAGEHAALGNSIAMALWCLTGFLIWAPRHWTGNATRQNLPIK